MGTSKKESGDTRARFSTTFGWVPSAVSNANMAVCAYKAPSPTQRKRALLLSHLHLRLKRFHCLRSEPHDLAHNFYFG